MGNEIILSKNPPPKYPIPTVHLYAKERVEKNIPSFLFPDFNSYSSTTSAIMDDDRLMAHQRKVKANKYKKKTIKIIIGFSLLGIRFNSLRKYGNVIPKLNKIVQIIVAFFLSKISPSLGPK